MPPPLSSVRNGDFRENKVSYRKQIKTFFSSPHIEAVGANIIPSISRSSELSTRPGTG